MVDLAFQRGTHKSGIDGLDIWRDIVTVGRKRVDSAKRNDDRRWSNTKREQAVEQKEAGRSILAIKDMSGNRAGGKKQSSKRLAIRVVRASSTTSAEPLSY